MAALLVASRDAANLGAVCALGVDCAVKCSLAMCTPISHAVQEGCVGGAYTPLGLFVCQLLLIMMLSTASAQAAVPVQQQLTSGTCMQAERAEQLWQRNERRRVQIREQLAATMRALDAEQASDQAALHAARGALADMDNAEDSGLEQGDSDS